MCLVGDTTTLAGQPTCVSAASSFRQPWAFDRGPAAQQAGESPRLRLGRASGRSRAGWKCTRPAGSRTPSAERLPTAPVVAELAAVGLGESGVEGRCSSPTSPGSAPSHPAPTVTTHLDWWPGTSALTGPGSRWNARWMARPNQHRIYEPSCDSKGSCMGRVRSRSRASSWGACTGLTGTGWVQRTAPAPPRCPTLAARADRGQIHAARDTSKPLPLRRTACKAHRLTERRGLEREPT